MREGGIAAGFGSLVLRGDGDRLVDQVVRVGEPGFIGGLGAVRGPGRGALEVNKQAERATHDALHLRVSDAEPLVQVLAGLVQGGRGDELVTLALERRQFHVRLVAELFGVGAPLEWVVDPGQLAVDLAGGVGAELVVIGGAAHGSARFRVRPGRWWQGPPLAVHPSAETVHHLNGMGFVASDVAEREEQQLVAARARSGGESDTGRDGAGRGGGHRLCSRCSRYSAPVHIRVT
ncbi:hypothetical protein [Streptomyces sp900116325]|uniref:hypothetical protein n=1 Tax=Streptomyces sp. 900116325 TaxID=3154295 RepID=UPI0033A88405